MNRELIRFFRKRIKTLVASMPAAYISVSVLRSGITALLIFCVHSLFGGVVLDGSFGTSGALPGPNYLIPASVGKMVGPNLFQSFSQFNLNSSQSGTFTGPNTVDNILARVTSGSPSSIDGKVASTIPGANLFFMNPAGVIFGPHAQLSVSGSVAVTTANYLKLADGGKFNASLGGGDVLTSAPVSAFGFLSTAPAPVSITGSNLRVASQKSFSVIGGDINMTGGKIAGQGSRVNLVSAKSAGEAKLDATTLNSALDVTQFSAFGAMNLTASATINTTGPVNKTSSVGGGPVVIRSGTFELANKSSISAGTFSLGRAGDIDLQASAVRIIGGSTIASSTFGPGLGGDVTVIADSILIDGNGNRNTGLFALAGAGSSGMAGNITVQASDLLKITDTGRIAANSTGTGNAGNIDVTAGSLIIDGAGAVFDSITKIPIAAGIFANGVTGNGGQITVHTGAAQIISGGEIGTGTFGTGDGGSVTIHADSLLIDPKGTKDVVTRITLNKKSYRIFLGTGILAFGSVSGDGGNIFVDAGVLNIVAGGQIAAGTFGSGNGGNIRVIADSLLIDARSLIEPDSFFGTGIASSAQPGSIGKAGNVDVTAHDISIIAGGQIAASALGTGDSGNITVNGDSLLIDGNGLSTGILALAIRTSTGNGGNIALRLRDAVTITNGGRVAANTTGKGDGGKIDITAGSLFIGGGSPNVVFSNSGIIGNGIITTNAVTGDGGRITVNAGDVEIFFGGEISTGTYGAASAGSVDITADSLRIDGMGFNEQLVPIKLLNGPNVVFLGTGILAHSYAVGPGGGRGGNLTIDAQSLSLVRGGQIAAGTFGSGNGGSIEVSAGSIVIDGSGATGEQFFGTGIFVDAEAGSSGTAGTIDILRAGDATILGGGEISSSTRGSGAGGNVTLAANSLLIDGIGSAVSAASFTSASAGSLRLNLGSLTLDSGASISSANTSTVAGNAGNVTINASGDVKLRNGSSITTESVSGNADSIDISAAGIIKLSGHSSITASAGLTGGDINIMAPDLVYLLDSSITATAQNGTGGNITIDPTFIIVQNSLISANATVGTDGNVVLISDFLFTSDSEIFATGTINITAPELDLGAELITLPTSLLSAESQLQEQCAALLRGDFSSFISIGRGGTEPAPDELQTTF
jgi:filamentous hemagglutinin family protein